jgi:hypothetical protein
VCVLLKTRNQLKDRIEGSQDMQPRRVHKRMMLLSVMMAFATVFGIALGDADEGAPVVPPVVTADAVPYCCVNKVDEHHYTGCHRQIESDQVCFQNGGKHATVCGPGSDLQSDGSLYCHFVDTRTSLLESRSQILLRMGLGRRM